MNRRDRRASAPSPPPGPAQQRVTRSEPDSSPAPASGRNSIFPVTAQRTAPAITGSPAQLQFSPFHTSPSQFQTSPSQFQPASPSQFQASPSARTPASTPSRRRNVLPPIEEFRDGKWHCLCGIPMFKQTSHTPDNPGRCFYKCSSKKQDCSWYWADLLEPYEQGQTAASRGLSTPSQPAANSAQPSTPLRSVAPSTALRDSARPIPRPPQASTSNLAPPDFFARNHALVENSPFLSPLRNSAMVSSTGGSSSAGDEERIQKRLSENGNNDDDGSKRLRAGNPPSTPNRPLSMSSNSADTSGRIWSSSSRRVPRNTLLIASPAYKAAAAAATKRQDTNNNNQTTPTRVRPQPLPATAPAATRTNNVFSMPIPSKLPAHPQGAPASLDDHNHEFTMAIMDLIKNQGLPPATVQALREKVNHFAFTTHGQRATIEHLRTRIKEKDEIIEKNKGEIRVLRIAGKKMRSKIETHEECIDAYRERYDKDGINLVARGRNIIRKEKIIKELKARIAELEEQLAEGGDEQIGDAQVGIEAANKTQEQATGQDASKDKAKTEDISDKRLETPKKTPMGEKADWQRFEEHPDDFDEAPPSSRTRRRVQMMSRLGSSTNANEKIGGSKKTAYLASSDDETGESEGVDGDADDDSEFEEPDDESDDDYVDD